MIDLAVPLQEVWSYQQPHVPTPPVVNQGIVFHGDSERHTTAISEESQTTLWQSDGMLFPAGWWDGRLVGYASGKRSVQLIEPSSGRVLRETRVPGGCVTCVAGERWVAGTGYDERTTVWCLDPREVKVVSSKTLDEGVHVQGTEPVVTDDTVVLGAGNGEVLAFHAPTGDRRWISTVADLGWRRSSGQVESGRVRDRPSVFGDQVLLNVYDHYVVSLALQDGSRTWKWGGPPFVVRDGQLLDDKYHVLGWAGEYRILDARNGREVFAIDLRRQLPRDLQSIRLAPPLLATSSHILVGSERGHVTAFARDTGRFAWSYRPKGGGSTEYGEQRFVIGDNRIYFGDATMHIRCLAPEGKKKAARRRR